MTDAQTGAQPAPRTTAGPRGDRIEEGDATAAAPSAQAAEPVADLLDLFSTLALKSTCSYVVQAAIDAGLRDPVEVIDAAVADAERREQADLRWRPTSNYTAVIAALRQHRDLARRLVERFVARWTARVSRRARR